MAFPVENSQEQQRIPHSKLLTIRAKTYIRKGVKLGERVCCHPYIWNDAKGYPEFTTSRLQILGWVFNIGICVAYLIFLVLQCVQANSSSEEQATIKAFLTFTFILFSFPVFLHATILVAGERLTDYVRSYFSYYQDFEENYVRETARPSAAAQIGGILMTFMYYALPVDAILFTAYGLTRLNSPEQVSSTISDYPLVQAPLCIIFSLYYYTCYAANAFAVVFTAFGFLFASFDVMKELGKGDNNYTTEDFQRPVDRLRTYRGMQLLADATDRVYWIITAAAQYVLMLLAMFCTYGAIRLDGLVGILLGAIGVTITVSLIVFLSAWAEFYSVSLTAMKYFHKMTTRADVLENETMRAWLRKSAKSLRPARLPICGAYYIDKGLVLNAVDIVCNGIIFLLVNF